MEAKIEQGVSIPFSQVSANGVQTTFEDAKLSLTVKPHVTADGSVFMKVKVERNEPDFVNTGARGEPTILKKQAETEMLVKDGDTAVIGGIYTTRDGRSWQKVPWLADIPILGWLLQDQERQQSTARRCWSSSRPASSTERRASADQGDPMRRARIKRTSTERTMKRTMLAALSLIAAVTLGACVEDDASFYIEQNTFPGKGCIPVAGGDVLASGVLDVTHQRWAGLLHVPRW